LTFSHLISIIWCCHDCAKTSCITQANSTHLKIPCLRVLHERCRCGSGI